MVVKNYLIILLFVVGFVHLLGDVVFADELYFPTWIFTVYDFLIHERISYEEFGNTIQYLQKHKIAQLVMNYDYDPVTNFLITSSIGNKIAQSQFLNCSSDWYITGYFTPVEDDYAGDLIGISLNNKTQYFKSDFISVIKTEGWGKTNSGVYLGWYDESFHISNSPLDSHGDVLLVPSIAVDSELIKQKTNLIIPKLPYPWNEIIFESSDIGPSITGKHIDVYAGEGKAAELETFRITGAGNDVCS
jgi:3D (Asp-Asp-Asp) domain-containing protein